MVVGRLPLYNPDPIDFMDDLVEKEVEIPADLSPALQYPLCFCVFVFLCFCVFVFLCCGGLNVRDLLGRFLDKDPAKRISIDEILVAMEGRSDA